MKTILFLLQKNQFSAAVNKEVCKFKGGKSMAFEAYKIEEIVKAFEKCNVFLKLGSCWNDTKLFILYDSESAKYLFNIIDGFELKNKVESCENFSFQIKLEEKPIDLNGNADELLKYIENGGAVVIAEKDKEFKALKNEADTLRNEIEQKERKINDLSQEVTSLNNELKQVKEKEKELKSKISELEESPLFIDKGDYIDLSKLTKPICNIHMIEKYRKSTVNYYDAEEYARKLRIGGFDDWRLPCLNEIQIVLKISDLYGIEKGGWGSCWVSSDRKSSRAMFVIDSGKWYFDEKTDGRSVLCVR